MNDINQLIENMSEQEKTLILSKILGYIELFDRLGVPGGVGQ